MRKIVCGFFVCSIVFGLAVLSRADDQADARAIIDKAIKAQGGADKLAKVKAQTWNEKGTYYGMGDGLPYTGKYAIQWPNQFRMEIENVFIIVLNGDKGWVSMGGATQEMTKEQLVEQQEAHFGGWITTLSPLKDRAFVLKSVGESKVESRPALGVKVSHKDHRDVMLYFDKETGLLIKSEQRVKAEELGGKEVTQENFYSNHRAVDGIKLPTKIVMKREGKRFVEAENSDVKLSEKLDDKVFSKP